MSPVFSIIIPSFVSFFFAVNRAGTHLFSTFIRVGSNICEAAGTRCTPACVAGAGMWQTDLRGVRDSSINSLEFQPFQKCWISWRENHSAGLHTDSLPGSNPGFHLASDPFSAASGCWTFSTRYRWLEDPPVDGLLGKRPFPSEANRANS